VSFFWGKEVASHDFLSLLIRLFLFCFFFWLFSSGVFLFPERALVCVCVFGSGKGELVLTSNFEVEQLYRRLGEQRGGGRRV
jgi:hypothetical protein